MYAHGGHGLAGTQGMHIFTYNMVYSQIVAPESLVGYMTELRPREE